MDLLDRLLEHDHWATTCLLDLSRDLTDEQLDRPFDIGHETLRATLGHIVHNIEAWTSLMIQQPIEGVQNGQPIAEIAACHDRAYATFAEVARRAREEQRLEDTFTDFYGSPMTFGGGILHVILHNAEHRTEAVHILHRLGLPDVPEVDHALWDFKRRGYD